MFPQGAPRRLIAAFVLLLVLPATAVVWLGVRLVIQDRQLESDQLRKRRESTAARIVTALNDRLVDAERALASNEPPGDDAVRIKFTDVGVAIHPGTKLLFYPGLRVDDDSLPDFLPGELLEHSRNDLDAAETAFQKLTSHRSASVRAGALVRLARVLRKRGAPERALRIYDDVANLTGERIDGVPAALVARRARCRTLEEMNDAVALRTEATALRAGLLAATWEIDHGTFKQYMDETEHWLGLSTIPSPAQEAMAEAVEWLWEHRGTSGHVAQRFNGVDMTLLWRSSGHETQALLAGPAFQQRHWLPAVRAASAEGDMRAGLASPGEAVAGTVGAHETTLRQPSSESGLPWDVIVSSGDSSPIGSNRRVAMVAGLGFLVLLVIAGGYVIVRAVSRELAVARLQSDFVASVSHEFRTPLTSLRQFTDLLNEADDLPEDKRRHFYAAQSRATERLQRLVESLLDFRRMEAGTHPYQRRLLAVGPLVARVVEDFRPEATARGFDVEYRPTGDARTIDADAEALSLALWNLLDNAVKYSGESRHVSVFTTTHNGSVEISVRDRGLGVPREEQDEIFRQFVRGKDARIRGIKGTGIGLAMVKHIAQGHGGRVAVESATGQGSTFTIVLPAVPSEPSASRGVTE